MKIKNNVDLVQSYVMTTAKYSFSASEKRVLYRIIEVLQSKTKGLKLKYDYTLQEDLFGNTIFTLPIACFLSHDEDNNYDQVKKALKSLRQKGFEYEDSEGWGFYGIIEMPKIKTRDSFVTFTVQPLLLNAFLNFSKGYRKYELKVAMSFESHYSMRFYELFSNKTEPITYSIEALKKMFDIEDKYTNRPSSFIEKVIIPAQLELTKTSPYSFKYEVIKTGRKLTHITFKPYLIPKNRDTNLEKDDLVKEVSLRYTFSKETILLLETKFNFTQKGITNNLDLIKKAVSSLDFLDECNDINSMIRKYEIKNPSGFFISEIKKRLENAPSVSNKENQNKILERIKKIANK